MVRSIGVCVLGALLGAACAKPSAAGGDAGVGGNGSDVDLADPVDLQPAPDLALVCGDGVCSASIGEACDTCPGDCGVCPGCPQGYADCNHNMADGCETPINTPQNCGACGFACAQTGGTNACVAQNTTYVCQPTCDANHADCNKVAQDGCEVDLSGPNNCGACGVACQNPHGTTVCTTQGAGWFCNPTCDSGWGACGSDKTAGCTTNLTNDPDHCGDCGRPCSGNGVANRACTNSICTPTCASPWSDCSDPSAPTPDDGCETNGTADPGEPDNSCGQAHYNAVDEGNQTTLTIYRILPAGDSDAFHVRFNEGSHFCFPGTGQNYDAAGYVSGPGNPQLNFNTSTCNDTWTTYGNGVCIAWKGTCSSDDSRDFYFQVFGLNGQNSCGYYSVQFIYASEGNKVSGCP